VDVYTVILGAKIVKIEGVGLEGGKTSSPPD